MLLTIILGVSGVFIAIPSSYLFVKHEDNWKHFVGLIGMAVGLSLTWFSGFCFAS